MKLETKNLNVWIDSKQVLKNINLEFTEGVYVIKGPNGSGKSTLLKTIAGYPYKIQGKIFFENKDITSLPMHERVKLGIVLSHQMPPKDLEIQVKDLIWALEKKSLIKYVPKELENFLKRKMYEEFSGGEAKLVDFLVSYALDPKVFLIDEIDSGLDERNIELVGKLLSQMKNRIIILTTHTGKILEYLKPKVIIYLENGEIKDIRKA